MSQVLKFKSGQPIFAEDEECNGLYIVTSGMVHIYRRLPGSEPKDVLLAQVGIGGMFGEMSAVDLRGRSAAARAMTDAELVHIGSDEFVQQLGRLPMWALLLVQMLVRRLRSTNDQLMRAQGQLESLQKLVADQGAREPGVELVKESEITAEKIIEDLSRGG